MKTKGQEKMSFESCTDCTPDEDGMAKILVHNHITEYRELASLVGMIAQNFPINKRLTFLLIEDTVNAQEHCSESGMNTQAAWANIKRESTLNDYLSCEMKTIKTEGYDDDDEDDEVPDASYFPGEEEDCEAMKSYLKENEHDDVDAGKYINRFIPMVNTVCSES